MATIMVVDDDQLTVAALTALLGRSGHTVLAARTGPQGLTWLESVRPDIVLLDLNMPGLDGFGLLFSISQGPRTRGVPVLILTGHIESLEGKNLPPNVTEIMKKPQTPEAILGAIERALHPPTQ